VAVCFDAVKGDVRLKNLKCVLNLFDRRQ